MSELLRKYLAEGFSVIPIPRGEKGPRIANWQKTTFDEAAFGVEDNIGVRLGEPSGHLIDVDLDCMEAVAMAPAFLPDTQRKHGRPSKPQSHFFFYCEAVKKPISFKDGNGNMILEVRTTGQQTVLPPSLHPSGERLSWVDDGPPARVGEGLLEFARYLATACLLARCWPANGPTTPQHDLAGCVAGFLAARGVPAAIIERIVGAACEYAHDENPADRRRFARDTEEKFGDGRTPIAGGPKLAEIIGEKHFKALARWWQADADDLILCPGAPLPSARAFVELQHTVSNTLALRHQASVFYQFDREVSAYTERDEASVRAELYRFLEAAKRRTDEKPPRIVPFNPSKSKVENVLDALRAVCNLPTSRTAPCWLDLREGPEPLDMLAVRNGLLEIPTRTLHPATPEFFSLNGLEFAFDPTAPTPAQWLAFLHSVWPDDPDSITTLQELFGYFLTPDTRFQKIGMIIGPKRSGKGTIARVLRSLVGARNTCNPTLAAFGRDFGKQVLVNKTLAVISDARISGRTDTATVAETLLSISGGDDQTVERKFLPDWNGKLHVRFLILANELPKIGDASGALTSRFITLVMRESFYGREDLHLSDRLASEMGGILLWALEGRDRLYARGHFAQPESAKALIEEFTELSSPEGAFVRECCEAATVAEVPQAEVFRSWLTWCAANGHHHPGTTQTFARSLRSVLPRLATVNRRVEGGRERMWVGLRLRTERDPEAVPLPQF